MAIFESEHKVSIGLAKFIRTYERSWRRRILPSWEKTKEKAKKKVQQRISDCTLEGFMDLSSAWSMYNQNSCFLTFIDLKLLENVFECSFVLTQTVAVWKRQHSDLLLPLRTQPNIRYDSIDSLTYFSLIIPSSTSN